MAKKGVEALEYRVIIDGLPVAVTSDQVSFEVYFYTRITPYEKPLTWIEGTVDIIAGDTSDSVVVSAPYADVMTLPDGNLFAKFVINLDGEKRAEILVDLERQIEHIL